MLANKPAGQSIKKLIRAETRRANDTEMVFLQRHTHGLLLQGALGDSVCGLVALTQDKRLAQKLAECEMEFLVCIETAPPLVIIKEWVAHWQKAGQLKRDDKVTRQSDRQLRFVLHAPAQDLVDSLCRGAGLAPVEIRCNRIGRLALGDLPSGQWRYLSTLERF